MQAFIVLHKPTGKFFTSGVVAKRKSEVLRKTKGQVFNERAAAERSVNCAIDPRLKSLYPPALHGAKKKDFLIAPLSLDLVAAIKGKRP